MKKWCLGMVVLFLFGLSTVVFAAPPDQGAGDEGTAHQGMMEHQGMMAHQCKAHHPHGFNFSPEQKAKMHEIRKAFWADTHDLRYDIHEKRVELKKLFTDPKVDSGTLLAKEKELNAMKQRLMDRRAEMKIEWRKVLTPVQIAMLDRPEGRFGHYHHEGHFGPHHHPMADR